MNRIKISPLATASFDEQPKSDNGCEVKNSLTETAPGHSPGQKDFSIFVPLHYEKNYQYPLVVWLHNDGDDTNQIQRIMPGLSLQNYAAVAPQASVGDAQRGYYWEQTRDAIESAHESIEMAIDNASMRLNINTERIFIGGFGAAGTMAYRVAFDRPELFAGVMSINGPLPEQLNPLRGWKNCRQLELFWAHCRNSIDFDQAKLCRQLRLLHIAGFSVTLRQYPGGDSLNNQTLSDVNRWIMESISSSVLD